MQKKRIFKKSLADELHKLGNEILKVEINILQTYVCILLNNEEIWLKAL